MANVSLLSVISMKASIRFEVGQMIPTASKPCVTPERDVSAMLFSREAQRGKPLKVVKGSRDVLNKGATGAVLEERVKARRPNLLIGYGSRAFASS
jgi:hypothetical protein